jgi:ATP-dependent Clp protease ATP-binding subunit ClpA
MLHHAVAEATGRKHEFATTEHLLLALTEDPDGMEIIRACGVDLDQLREQLTDYLDTECGGLIVEDGQEAMPSSALQRVIRRAVIRAQSSQLDEVTSANVLVALFSERESYAAQRLREQDMSYYDAVRYIVYGIVKSREEATRGAAEQAARDRADAADREGRRAARLEFLDRAIGLRLAAKAASLNPAPFIPGN